MKPFLLFVFVFFSSLLIAQEKPIGSIVTKDLQHQMDQKTENDLIRINIRLINQYDLQNLNDALANMEQNARRAMVISELKSFSENTQRDILKLIDARSKSQQAKLIYSLWINNVITCMATKDVIYELSFRNDIDRIDWDEETNMLMIDDFPKPDASGETKGTKEIAWNINQLNVTDVWALGFTGAGIMVGIIDSGVNYNHNDLQDHVWDGGTSYPNHGYDFYNNDNDPMDDHGHGTHCAGTVAGDGTAGSQTGMAPDATIMALKVLSGSGSGSESAVWSAIQFAVDNGCDIISMSIGWTYQSNPDKLSWRTAHNNALAAGLIAAVAAGNEGDALGTYPIPNNLRTPGDCPPPWTNPEQTLTGGNSNVVCVGATDINDAAASFTSNGPATWTDVSGFNDYAYNPGMGLIRPDVSAPGVNIKSLDYSSNTGYADGWNGTSMATPAVAGVMALMLDKNPNLTPLDINMALETTALDLGSAGKDNIFGAGRINGLAAVNAVSGPGPVYNSHTINDSNGNNNGEVEAGESILLSIEMINNSISANNDVTVNITTSSPYVTISDNNEYYGNFAVGQMKSVTNGFAFDVAAGTPGLEDIQIEVEASNSFMTWNSQFSITTSGPNLEFGSVTISDPTGNNNGRLDPGETANITFPVLNVGNGDSPSASALLSSVSTYMTINSGSATLGVIGAGGSANAVFNITCDGSTPIGTAVDLTVDVEAGDYDISNTFYQSVGLVLEDWETGAFFSFPWEFAGTADWTLTTVDPYEGAYCAKSGTITHNETSELVINVETTNADNISFFRKVSSESSYDYLQFWIDGTQQEQWSGEVAWGEVSYSVAAGVHEFKWVYTKDGSVSSGSDCGWVDYIIFPSIVPPPDPPDIDLSALSFEVGLLPDASTTEVLTISNVGQADLNYSISKYYQPTDSKAYCTSVGGGSDEFIQNVTIGTINNTTAQDFYSDYTAMSTVVNLGESYPIIITNGDPIWTTDQCGIWVDWNQNEDFSDDAPIVVSGTPGVGPYTATIIPPVDALPGLARMRVQIRYSATPDPCASFLYGEVEDYALNVNSSFVDWLTFNPVSGITPDGGSANIDLTFDATGMDEGDYYADLTITSNDPDEASVIVPCTLHVANQINVDLSAMLEGPFTGPEMNTILNSSGMLPLNQPFNTAPWNYSGLESVVSIPNIDVLDWVLVELRQTTGDASSATPATIIGKQAGFILKDGSIVDMDGASMLRFDIVVSQNLFAVVYHRNHLGIMSANPLVKSGENYTLDFSTSAGNVHGGAAALKEITSGVWAMYSGDGNSDGVVNTDDNVLEWNVQAGNEGFLPEDYNLDGQVNNKDKDDYWFPNVGKGTFIPN